MNKPKRIPKPPKRIPRKTFYILWMDGSPAPHVKTMCFKEELAKDLAIRISEARQSDVFILKATHQTIAHSLTDIRVRELDTTDPFEPAKEAKQ